MGGVSRPELIFCLDALATALYKRPRTSDCKTVHQASACATPTFSRAGSSMKPDRAIFDRKKIGHPPPIVRVVRVLTFMIDCLVRASSLESLFMRSTAAAVGTTNARGISPLYSSGRPTTQTSVTSGWSRRCPSSSAGATAERSGCLNEVGRRADTDLGILEPSEAPARGY